jgi:hypothetical protein
LSAANTVAPDLMAATKATPAGAKRRRKVLRDIDICILLQR